MAEVRDLAAASDVVADVRQGDAARPELYADAVPADLLLLAGIFGNISDENVRGLFQRLSAAVCPPRARDLDAAPRRARPHAADPGPGSPRTCFEEQSFTAPPDVRFTVGVHDFAGPPVQRAMPERLFTFFR